MPSQFSSKNIAPVTPGTPPSASAPRQMDSIARWLANCSSSDKHLDACSSLLAQSDLSIDVQTSPAMRSRVGHLKTLAREAETQPLYDTAQVKLPAHKLPSSPSSKTSTNNNTNVRLAHQRHRRSQSVTHIDTTSLLFPNAPAQVDPAQSTTTTPERQGTKRGRTGSMPVRFAEEKNRVHAYESVALEVERGAVQNDRTRAMGLAFAHHHLEKYRVETMKLVFGPRDDKAQGEDLPPIGSLPWTPAVSETSMCDVKSNITTQTSLPLTPFPYDHTYRPARCHSKPLGHKRLPFTDRLLLQGDHSHLGLFLDHSNSKYTILLPAADTKPETQFTALGFVDDGMPEWARIFKSNSLLSLKPSPIIVNHSEERITVTPLEKLYQLDQERSASDASQRSSISISRSSSESMSVDRHEDDGSRPPSPSSSSTTLLSLSEFLKDE
ncbi:hypothetical protein CI109_100390 [Kwoniella shandongensis]|uniref:Uncharacterized protein n=1 Tax=Kwoniella shandongensis TaxID=1734106 RepID=A0A5M6C3V2_9TREE|nr:uncharacterized protein CI109_001767 [Kwoniella shandongensis]KAA5529827.1 hypothetical protein CI109_001767 [Kwoniella shandongensis]